MSPWSRAPLGSGVGMLGGQDPEPQGPFLRSPPLCPWADTGFLSFVADEGSPLANCAAGKPEPPFLTHKAKTAKFSRWSLDSMAVGMESKGARAGAQPLPALLSGGPASAVMTQSPSYQPRVWASHAGHAQRHCTSCRPSAQEGGVLAHPLCWWANRGTESWTVSPWPLGLGMKVWVSSVARGRPFPPGPCVPICEMRAVPVPAWGQGSLICPFGWPWPDSKAP